MMLLLGTGNMGAKTFTDTLNLMLLTNNCVTANQLKDKSYFTFLSYSYLKFSKGNSQVF